MESNLVSYDKDKYDYSQYWTGREYENGAEELALESMLSDATGNYYVDIGGSFGRLTHLYAKRFKTPVIADYSIETLQKFREELESHFPGIILVAANAYKLPFKDGIFDGGQMVRVLHHIQNPSGYFQEINRVMKLKSLYIQEYANKLHLKARIKWLLTGRWSNFSIEPYQQPSLHNYDSVFLNFHNKYISLLINKFGFSIEEHVAVSFFRTPLLKRIFKPETLIKIEGYAQKLLGSTYIAPSIFLKCKKLSTAQNERTSKRHSNEKENITKPEDIFCCPDCLGKLNFDNKNGLAFCTECSGKYEKTDGIWDFRIS